MHAILPFLLAMFLLCYGELASGAEVAMSLSDVVEAQTLYVPLSVRAQFGFPLATQDMISSTFGPRWKYSQNRYDYHPGIDFYHANNVPILSIGDGQVYRIYVDPDTRFLGGGNTVAIRHTLTTPIQFHGFNVTYLYSMYLHLSAFAAGLAEGDTVTRGQTIGLMGQTGDTTFTHLHFETRLGTLCSLPFQIANPTSSCATMMKEPKVHPLLFFQTPLFPPLSSAMAGIAVYSDNQTKRITLTIPNRRSLALNRIVVGNIQLDFSLYTGFNPTDLSILDDFSQFTWGKLWPAEFVSASTTYNISIELNDASLLSGPIRFVDVWGNGIVATGSAGGGGGATSVASGTSFLLTVVAVVALIFCNLAA